MNRIVIIGGGFSGTLLSVHLLRRADARHRLHLTLVEREPRRLARGFAYSTPHQACLLNVPAGRMSAFEDDVEHFVRWARARDPGISGATFVPRALYGQYLASLLEDATRATSSHAKFEPIAGEAIGISDPPSPGPATVTLADGRRVDADTIVLAMGNLPPCDPPSADAKVLSGSRYTRNPWAADALSNISRDGGVLLIGSGLTMLDVALVLDESGHPGPFYAVSRRGLLPQPHRHSTVPPPSLPFPESMRIERPTLARLLRALRHEIESQSAGGVDWREVVTALRHDTPRLWQSLDVRGKRQFLVHLLPFWETHRHRAAPATAQRTRILQDRGRLIVRAARILRIEQDSQRVRVTLRRRGQAELEHLHVAHVINCTGPDPNLARSGGRLLQSAIERGLVRQDELELGLNVAPDGAAIHADGTISHRLYTIGPLRRALLWETTAVPELRIQAAELAHRIVAEYGKNPSR